MNAQRGWIRDSLVLSGVIGNTKVEGEKPVARRKKTIARLPECNLYSESSHLAINDLDT